MKIKLNGDYAKRHLFVALLLAGLACWFGYDGFVRYPAMPAAELYRSIEGTDPRVGMNLEAFKRQKTQTQYGFTFLALLGAAIVGLRLLRSARFDCEFDEAGFSVAGRRYAYGDVTRVRREKWASKGIAVLELKDGRTVTLDAWHHLGVREFMKKFD